MENKSTVLLAAFRENDPDEIQKTVRQIQGKFDLLNGKIFLIIDVDNSSYVVLTFNIVLDESENEDFLSILPNCVSLHRKKETNTLYTLNALNEIVIKETGKIDKSFQVDWQRYKNMLLLTQKDRKAEPGDRVLKEIRTKVVKIYEDKR